MADIRDEILEQSQAHSLNIRELPDEEALLYRKILGERFSKDPENPLNLSYYNMLPSSSYYDLDQQAWLFIQEFVGSMDSIVLFANPDQGLFMFELTSGRDLTHLIGECFGFPFYVSAKPFDFLICLDDNNCLMCTGTAKEWGESLVKNRPPRPAWDF